MATPGSTGFESPILGGVDFNERRPLFYVTAVAAVLIVVFLRYVMASPVGLAFRGLRDNRKRLAALGYNPGAVTVAAFTVSGVAAGAGGVLSVWYNGAISPGSINITRIIELLVVVTIGGAIRIEGAFLGGAGRDAPAELRQRLHKPGGNARRGGIHHRGAVLAPRDSRALARGEISDTAGVRVTPQPNGGCGGRRLPDNSTGSRSTGGSAHNAPAPDRGRNNRMRRRKTTGVWRLLGVLVTLLLIAAACGGDDGEEATPPVTTAAPEPAPPPATTESAPADAGPIDEGSTDDTVTTPQRAMT